MASRAFLALSAVLAVSGSALIHPVAISLNASATVSPVIPFESSPLHIQ